MTSRRYATVLLLVVALSISAVTVVSAHSGKSKAEFEASAAVLGVGAGHIFVPGAEFSTDVRVKYKGRGENRQIDRIRVKTKDEGVLGGFTAVHPGCIESGIPGACATTSVLLDGQAILSLHDSKATLKLLTEPFDLGAVNPLLAGVEGYFGTLDGKLRGDFVVGGLPGKAKLNIAGTGTYACFTATGFPLPDVGACTKGGDGYDPANVFVPVQLTVEDTGSFKIKVEPGQVVVGDRELRKMTGNLTVNVDAPGATGTPPFGSIVITDATAKYVSLEHDHGEDDDEDDDD